MSRNSWLVVALLGLLMSLAACGGGGGAGGNDDGGSGGGGSGGGGDGGGGGGGGTGSGTCPSGDTVECALVDLGVDTAASAREVRIDEDTTMELPESYSPLGSTPSISRFAEIFTLGFPLDQGQFGTTNAHAVTELVPGANNNFTSDVLFAPPEADTPWTSGGFRSAGAAADVDGDGRDEMLVVYRDISRGDTSVELVVLDDAVDGNGISEPVMLSTLPARNFVIEAGDFDGDGDIEAAVGLMMGDTAQLLFLNNENGSLGVAGGSGQPVAFTAEVHANGLFALAFEAGNLDFDNGQELAAIVNEYAASHGNFGNSGVARYAIFDDAGSGYAELDAGTVSVNLSSGTAAAMGADIAVGDVDGDGVDEVVLGGLTDIGDACSLNASYVVVVLDDQPRGFAELKNGSVPYEVLSNACGSGTNRQLTFAHVNTADVDDDAASEIQVNGLIFQDLREADGAAELALAHEIPQGEMLWDPTLGNSATFSWLTSSVTAADVTSDGREDIIFVAQSGTTSELRQVHVWGLDQIDGWSRIHAIPADLEQSQISGRPQVIPANVNDDSLALRYSAGSHRFVFTEPVIIAALAAAPCSVDLGQTVGDCRTAFGKGTSSSVSTENAWSVSVGASVGYEAGFSFLGTEVGGAEAVATVQRERRKITQNTYTLTKRVVHTTGPIEDSVIFTTVPLDVYTYTILSHPNPTLVGGEVQVRLPRDPISVMVDRNFYNDNVDDDSFQVDDRVLGHVAGDPFSYPDVAARNALLSQFEGLSSDEVDVGQGTGFVTAEINVFEEVATGQSYSLDTTVDLRTTAGGVLTGATFGSGAESTFVYSRGQESIYEGSVAQLPDANFPEDAYRFGLFSYVFEDASSGQAFEVVNYWVRPQE